MSGCADVCLDHDYDGFNEFYSDRLVTARKPHKCCECGGAIGSGQRYQRASGKNDGNLWTEATCAVCAEIRAAFVCGTWIFGELWESIRETMFPIWETLGPLDCLAKLTTLGAREKCRAEYAKWQARYSR